MLREEKMGAMKGDRGVVLRSADIHTESLYEELEVHIVCYVAP